MSLFLFRDLAADSLFLSMRSSFLVIVAFCSSVASNSTEHTLLLLLMLLLLLVWREGIRP